MSVLTLIFERITVSISVWKISLSLVVSVSWPKPGVECGSYPNTPAPLGSPNPPSSVTSSVMEHTSAG